MPFPANWLSASRVSDHCRNQSTIAAVLKCWLAEHPNVESELYFYSPSFPSVPLTWSDWPATLRKQLAHQVSRFLWWYADGAPSRFPLSFKTPLPKDPPGDPLIFGGLVMDEARATNVYFGHVANSLALELAGVLPWSVTTYTPDALRRLFDWNDLLQYRGPGDANQPGYYLMNQSSPATPGFVFRFFKTQQLLGADAVDTVARLFAWCRILIHYYGVSGVYPDPTQFWGPDAPPVPVSMVINGSNYTGGGASTFGHYTMACAGTSEFFKSVLRIVNIPTEVRYDKGAGHAMPYFSTIDRALSHGDDPYDALGAVTAFDGWPVPEPSEYLITGEQWEQWFGANVDADTSKHNVGRRPAEIGVEYLSDWLLKAYCDDLASNATHADGKVAESLSYSYSLAELEAMQLWDKLAAKAAATGYCTITGT